MKAYPTVDDLPDDIRVRFSGDALEVYRAAYNISYAYEGNDPEVAAREAEVTAQKTPRRYRTLREFALLFGVLVAARWILGGADQARLPGDVFWAALMSLALFWGTLYEAGKQKRLWLTREAESLDADGNRTLHKRPRWDEPNVSNGYYPTVAYLPHDLQARLSDDALNVYRAAFNISYAYDGNDTALAAHGAENAARDVNTLRQPRWFAQAGVPVVAILMVGFLWARADTRLIPYYIVLVGIIAVPAGLFIGRWQTAKWRARTWYEREAELLDADGNPTMPGAASPMPQPSPSSGGTEPMNVP